MNKKNDILSIAREVLLHESNAIKEAHSLVDENFVHAVELICSIKPAGRLVTTGIGKAGMIANKISATFASTGQPSFFLHPSEGAHGDLGRFTPEDVILILSNSGSTEEIIKLLPHIKRIGCKIIALTGSTKSPLTKHSDVSVCIGTVKEAGKLGLAPTASTTVMLAFGDALAIAVLDQKNLSKEDFALYHPGGALGRSLLLVSDLMRTGDENCIVPEDMNVREALKVVTSTKGRPGAAAIVNKKGELVGVFTDGNLRRCLAEGTNFLELPISKVMGTSPKTITPEKLAEEALKIMHEHKIDQLLIVDESRKPIGLLDIQDLTSTR